jgi:flagella basal body P-ring formation protein FlgA
MGSMEMFQSPKNFKKEHDQKRMEMINNRYLRKKVEVPIKINGRVKRRNSATNPAKFIKKSNVSKTTGTYTAVNTPVHKTNRKTLNHLANRTFAEDQVITASL